jgi:hypothetical protein
MQPPLHPSFQSRPPFLRDPEIGNDPSKDCSVKPRRGLIRTRWLSRRWHQLCFRQRIGIHDSQAHLILCANVGTPNLVTTGGFAGHRRLGAI